MATCLQKVETVVKKKAGKVSSAKQETAGGTFCNRSETRLGIKTVSQKNRWAEALQFATPPPK